MDSLIYNSKIEVKKSPIHGYGIFAKENINKNEVLEECLYIVQDKNSYNFDYLFAFPNKNNQLKYNVLPLGYGCIYNSSKTKNEKSSPIASSFLLNISKLLKGIFFLLKTV